MFKVAEKSLPPAGEGGEATVAKNTSKAACPCALSLVPRAKAQGPSARASPDMDADGLCELAHKPPRYRIRCRYVPIVGLFNQTTSSGDSK